MTPPKPEKFEQFDALLASRLRPLASPWVDGRYEPDWPLLHDLLSVAIKAGGIQAGGGPAAAVDAWASHELRRAGFDPDEVWPRATRPRVLTRELVKLIDAAPKRLADQLADRLAKMPSVAPASANILGRAYVKQADVLIASWARGPELLISTKTMLGAYSKNLRNRFEEAYGDAKNIRGRFPLVALGFLFLVRSDIPAGDLVFAQDMLRKLTDEADAYDTAALVVGEWDEMGDVTVRHDLVGDERLTASAFFAHLVRKVLDHTPVDHHHEVRNREAGSVIPVEEGSLDPLPEDERDSNSTG